MAFTGPVIVNVIVAFSMGLMVALRLQIIEAQKIDAYVKCVGALSGRDMAAGKSWEAWLKNYWERKAAGEKNIGIQPEELE